MRGLIWIFLFVLGATGVAVPIVFLYGASQLPRLESELDLERLLRSDIEAERMSALRPAPFERPDFAKLPRDLVGLYISQRGCSTFFQTPREDGFKWAWRVVLGVFGVELAGDGWCERVTAGRLAVRIGARSQLQRAVGAYKIHRFLQKDQLIAYDLNSVKFDHAVIGVEAAALELFKKSANELSLAEKAELQLALPPHNFYEQISECRNSSLIRQNRDDVLKQLQADSLVPDERVRNALEQPLACNRQ